MRPQLSALLALLLPSGCIEYGVKSFATGGGTSIEEVLSEPDTQTDSWEATGTDLIFFGDTSDSMTTELETMGENALTFMDRLDDYDDNWRIIVVTGWDGCAVNGVLSTEVANYDALFAEALVTPPESDAVEAGADEWGLYNVDMAVQESGPGGCNAGFLREDALLHVIVLSDEDDSSPDLNDEGESYWQSYVDNVIAAKASEHLVTFSAVVGPEPDGCDGAYPGSSYTEAVNYTSGALLSICEKWYEDLETLVIASVAVADFTLSRVPDTSSIVVEVNGTERASGWEYVSSNNLVHFSEDLPTIRDAVSITYDVAG